MDSLEANGEAELDISEHALEPLQAVGGFNSHSLGISRVHQASLSKISGFRAQAANVGVAGHEHKPWPTKVAVVTIVCSYLAG